MGLFRREAKEAATSILKEGGKIIDEISTSDDEKSAAKNKLSIAVFDAVLRIAEIQASIINTEATGNWLQRSWRPILMLTFGWIIVFIMFSESLLGVPVTVNFDQIPKDLWDLMKLGITGYVGGRTIEKVAKDVTKNIDVPFLRKRDRKEKFE